MAREYLVDVIDESGKLIMRMKATVVKKEQSSGRIAGTVKEKLFVSKVKFTTGEPFEKNTRKG